MNVYEIKTDIVIIAGKTVCDPCLSTLSVRYSGTTQRVLCKSSYLYLPCQKNNTAPGVTSFASTI